MFSSARACILIIPIVLGSVLSGCATVPVDAVRDYAAAYDQGRHAGGLLLDEVAPFVRDQDDSRSEHCPSTEDGYPECFDPGRALLASAAGDVQKPAIAVRRAALDIVAAYNDLLIDIAEGRSSRPHRTDVAELRDLSMSLADLAGTASPALPVLADTALGSAERLADALGEARTTAAVRRAVIDSSDDVIAILTSLQNDTPTLYDLYKAAREVDLVTLNEERNLARLRDDVAGMDEAETRMDAVTTSIVAYHDGLAAYVRMLDRSATALEGLVAAIEDTGVSAASLAVVARNADAVRHEADAVLAAAHAVRTGGDTAN